MQGDVSIQYQTERDLFDRDRPDLQARIERVGWGARLLACRNVDGGWGQRFYQPKWTSSHYSLLDLKMLAISPTQPLIRKSIASIMTELKGPDGGIYPIGAGRASDVCVNGMFLNYASYFGAPQADLTSIVDFLLDQRMPDGGFNCLSNSVGARHSSLHSTLSVLEGIHEYDANGYTYRRAELRKAAQQSREFVLLHRFYKSDHSGLIIRKDFLKLVYPPRWKYNILRALDHFQAVQAPWDERMQDALGVLVGKRKPEGRWPAVAGHPGQVHFTMEKPRAPGRWNTLLALRVIKAYGSNSTKM